MNAAEVARKAATIMSERGHCKNTLEDDKGRVCYIGAVLVAIGGTVNFCSHPGGARLFDAVTKQSQKLLLERGYEIEVSYPHIEGTYISRDPVAFNNDPAVTGEDVILLLKETAERLEDAR